MDFSKVAEQLGREWAVFTSAPTIVVTLVIIVAVALWFAARWFYGREIATLNSLIRTKEGETQAAQSSENRARAEAQRTTESLLHAEAEAKKTKGEILQLSERLAFEEHRIKFILMDGNNWRDVFYVLRRVIVEMDADINTHATIIEGRPAIGTTFMQLIDQGKIDLLFNPDDLDTLRTPQRPLIETDLATAANVCFLQRIGL